MASERAQLPSVYRGQVPSHSEDASLTLSQPYIDQDEKDPPKAADITVFREAYNFVKVAADKVVNVKIKEAPWYRHKDGILITDAFPRNFRMPSGPHALVPIDLMVSLVPTGGSKLLPSPKTPWKAASDRCM